MIREPLSELIGEPAVRGRLHTPRSRATTRSSIPISRLFFFIFYVRDTIDETDTAPHLASFPPHVLGGAGA